MRQLESSTSMSSMRFKSLNLPTTFGSSEIIVSLLFDNVNVLSLWFHVPTFPHFLVFHLDISWGDSPRNDNLPPRRPENFFNFNRLQANVIGQCVLISVCRWVSFCNCNEIKVASCRSRPICVSLISAKLVHIRRPIIQLQHRGRS